jgi:hypothetical protein
MAHPVEWLVLFFQLPAKYSPARVKAWRRLQRIGAVTLKNSAYVLPNNAEAREDLEWIKTEIIAIGGQTMVMGADALDPGTRQEVVELFRAARSQDFEAIRDQVQTTLRRWRSRPPSGTARRRLVQSVRRLRERFKELEAIDYFDAPHRLEAAQVLDELDRGVRKGQTMAKQSVPLDGNLDVNKHRGRVWLTRSRPGVDRMSSAWLIRRFIDPNATFAFGDSPNPEAIPFDMFGVEFGHHGTSCTFETIAERFAIKDPGVNWLGRIVHDLDLKEDSYGVPEKDTVGRMVEGLRRMYRDDQRLLDEGIAMFEALYQSYGEHEPAPAATASPRKRSTKRRRARRRV